MRAEKFIHEITATLIAAKERTTISEIGLRLPMLLLVKKQLKD